MTKESGTACRTGYERYALPCLAMACYDVLRRALRSLTNDKKLGSLRPCLSIHHSSLEIAVLGL